MSIPKWLGSEFSSAVRTKGETYFRDGAVFQLRRKGDLITAKVSGSYDYDVEVDADGADFDCTCPYFSDEGFPCKHIWAVILAANAAGLLVPGNVDVFPISSAFAKSAEREGKPRKKSPSPPPWKSLLDSAHQATYSYNPRSTSAVFPSDRRILYVVNLDESDHAGNVVVEPCTQKLLRNGTWDRPKRFGFSNEQWASAPDETDRLLAQMLNGAAHDYGYGNTYSSQHRVFVITSSAYETTLATMCRTGRCGILDDGTPAGFTPLSWDDGPPWEFALRIAPSPDAKDQARLEGILRRGEIRRPVDVLFAVEGGVMVHDGQISRFDHRGAWPLMQSMSDKPSMQFPTSQLDAMLASMAKLSALPPMEISPELGIETISHSPAKHLAIKKSNTERIVGKPDFVAKLEFDYGGTRIPLMQKSAALFDPSTRRMILRDRPAEIEAWSRIDLVRQKNAWNIDGGDALLSGNRLPELISPLLAEGWHVEGEVAPYRRAIEWNVAVSSGIDWFELDATIDFGATKVGLPRLLEALEHGHKWVELEDKSIGLLSDELIAQFSGLAGLGKRTDDKLTFSTAQVGFLDALLASMPKVSVDQKLQRVREELAAFECIKPVEAPKTFSGELREYQREGLGWLKFLQRFGFGGCLADDMGLGKTIQALALLESRRRAKAGASLVVVPRSLIFNWKSEAAKFAPKLRVLDHSGVGRKRDPEALRACDVVLTTYGTLRRDAGYFKDVEFDYVILDEAQAIKNASSDAAKAARLLRGRHRLAMTGTPVENHLGELWSLFEFLNPGMLGNLSVFKRLIGSSKNPDANGRQLLARALKPFILRRTKQQVAKDLPEKLEQTIYCELDAPQRKLYNELRDHYRKLLLHRVEEVGLGKSTFQILEALLRLRQAACHPALIDKSQHDYESAKLAVLAENIASVIDEDHKALVFSQFTSMLDLVRKRLDAQGTPYEYLDGQTRDRQERVNRFQTDPNCKLFLVSLKAGGVGLNLTAADYVFLLDPWWNPAVEAQAIDRTHRIGQTRNVFAYRLIARDTVEEKVLQLQQSKRDLANAIINEDNSVISSLKREDLELLLS